MTAISSFKPFADSDEIARNQKRAFGSWLNVFDAIVYFGMTEPLLASRRTSFVPFTGAPTLRLLVWTAALTDDLACVINADIVLAPHARELCVEAMRVADAATAFRFEFDPAKPEQPVSKVDNGLDMFIARRNIWLELSKCIPDDFVLGKPVWDSWCWAWLQNRCGPKFLDLTMGRFVFHPRHTRTQTALAKPVRTDV